MVSKAMNDEKANCSIKPSPQTRGELEQFADASNDAVRIINSDYTIRYINKAFAEMTGVNQNDVVGKKCWEVFPSPLCHTPDCRVHRTLDGEQMLTVQIERQNMTALLFLAL
jgi:PAS domain S-box-containing protein